MSKRFKVLKLSIVCILLLIINIPWTLFTVIVIGLASSMTVEYYGLKGLIPLLNIYIFILINSLLYFIFRALYNWAGKE